MNQNDRDFCYANMVRRLEQRFEADALNRAEIHALQTRLTEIEDQNRRMAVFIAGLCAPSEWGHAVPSGLVEQAARLLRFIGKP